MMPGKMDAKQVAEAIRNIWLQHLDGLAGGAGQDDANRWFTTQGASGAITLLADMSDVTAIIGTWPADKKVASISRQQATQLFLGHSGRPGDLARQSCMDFIATVADEIGSDYARVINSNDVETRLQAEIDKIAGPVIAKCLSPDNDSGLDFDVVRILGMAGSLNDAIAYRYFTDRESPSFEWRRQAMETMPMLSGQIGRTGILRDAVDKGEAMAPLLADLVGVKPKFLARFQKSIISTYSMAPVEFIRTMAKLPPDLVPKMDAEKLQHLALLTDVSLPFTTSYGIDLADFFKDSKGDWPAFARKTVLTMMERRMPDGISEEDGKLLIEAGKTLKSISEAKGQGTAQAVISALTQEWGLSGNDAAVRHWLLGAIDPMIMAETVLRNRIADLEMMVDTGRNEVVLPLAARAGKRAAYRLNPAVSAQAYSVASGILISGRNLPSAAETLHKYQVISEAKRSEENEIDPTSLKISSGDSLRGELGLIVPMRRRQWPEWMEPVQAPNGIWICDLHNDRLLYYEGANKRDPMGAYGLDHCCASMNSYNVGRCLSGNHILSLRKIVGDRYSRFGTACVRGFSVDAGDKQDLTEVEYRYFSNLVPPDEGWEALHWFFEEARKGNIRFDTQAIRDFADLAKEMAKQNDRDAGQDAGGLGIFVQDEITKICGFDWSNDDEMNSALDIWGPCLNKSMRQMPIDKMEQIESIQPVVTGLSPALEARKQAVSMLPRLSL